MIVPKPKKGEAYPLGLRHRLVELAWSGRSINSLSKEFGPSPAIISVWLAKANQAAQAVPQLTITETPKAAKQPHYEPRGGMDNVTDVEVLNYAETGAVALAVTFASGRMVQLVRPDPPKNYYSVLAKARGLEPEHREQIAGMCAEKGLPFP